jgi:hypothetical protein
MADIERMLADGKNFSTKQNLYLQFHHSLRRFGTRRLGMEQTITLESLILPKEILTESEFGIYDYEKQVRQESLVNGKRMLSGTMFDSERR